MTRARRVRAAALAMGIVTASAACAGAAAAAGAATAASAPPPALARASGEVTTVDRETRRLSLDTAEGGRLELLVPASVRAFDRLELRPGDRVRVAYVAPQALSMRPASGGERAQAAQAASARAPDGARTAPAEIEVIYLTANRVSFRGQRGELTTLPVSDPELRRRLPAFRAGQMVDLTYREAVAATIRIEARTAANEPAPDSPARPESDAAPRLLPRGR